MEKFSMQDAEQYIIENAEHLNKATTQTIENLTKSNAVFSEQLLSTVISANLGQDGLDGAFQQVVAKRLSQEAKKEFGLLSIEHDGKEFLTTPLMVEAENNIAKNAIAMSGEKPNDPYYTDADNRRLKAEDFGLFVGDTFGYSPHPQHISALQSLMTPKSNLTVISGPPGSGKSTLAQGLAFCTVNAYHKNPPDIYATAPSLKAANSIVEDMNSCALGHGVKSAGTLDLMIQHMEKGDIKKGSIVVVDEAGLMGAEQSAKLLKAAQESGIRLFMFGDAEQMPPEGSGNGFDQLLKMQKNGEIELNTVNLEVILRQGTLHEDKWGLKLRSASDENNDALEALDGYANRSYTKDGLAVVGNAGQELVVTYEKDTKGRDLRDSKGDKIPLFTPITPEQKGDLAKGLDFYDDKNSTFSKLADDYVKFELDNTERRKADKKERSSVVLASDEKSAAELNGILRDKMKAAGLITDTRDVGGMEIGEGDTLFIGNEIKTKEGDVKAGTQAIVKGFDEKGNIMINVNPKVKDSYVTITPDHIKESAKYGLALPMFQAQGQSKDRAFLAVTDKSLDRLSGGVAFTRHQEQMSAYVDRTVYPDTASFAKDLSNDRTRKKLVYDLAKTPEKRISLQQQIKVHAAAPKQRSLISKISDHDAPRKVANPNAQPKEKPKAEMSMAIMKNYGGKGGKQ